MPQHSAYHGTVLQRRDHVLLRDLFASRLTTIAHASTLFFEGSREAAKKRLQKLRAAGFISARSRRPQEAAIYSLTRSGYLALKREGMIDPDEAPGWARLKKRSQIGDFMLAHELAVLDAKAAFWTALAKHSTLNLADFSLSADRHKFRVVDAMSGTQAAVRFRSSFAKPDGFIQIAERRCGQPPKNHYFFLEVDRGTESLGRLLRKARQYAHYYRTGGFARRLGAAPEASRSFPFRVLMVFRTEQRRNNVAGKLFSSPQPTRGQVWLATMADLKRDPIGPVWMRPMDCESFVGPQSLRALFGS